MQTNKPFAEVLETTSNKLKAQCYNNKQEVKIGAVVLVQAKDQQWLTIVSDCQTGSRFPGGIQAFGQTENEIHNSYPELSFVETKTVELDILATVDLSSQSTSPTLTTPNPHTSVFEINEELLSKLLSNTRVIKSLCTVIFNSKAPELIFAGLCNQAANLKTLDKKNFYKTILLSTYQSCGSNPELLKRLCSTLEYFEPELQF